MPIAASFGDEGGLFNAASALFDGAAGKAAGLCAVAAYANAGSLSAWFKLDATQANTSYVTVWGVDAGAYIECYRSGSILYYRGHVVIVGNANRYTNGGLRAIPSPFSAWHHVVVTWDKTGYVVGYLDGVGTGNGDALGGVAMRTTGTSLMVGPAPTDGSGGWPKGTIDEMSAWTRQLSGVEVTELYSAGKPANLLAHSAAASLRGWWRLDGDTLPTISDHSGAGIAGTASAGVSISSEVP